MDKFIELKDAQKVMCDACGNAACPAGKIPKCSYHEKMEEAVSFEWHDAKTDKPLDGQWVLILNDDRHVMIGKYESEVYEWYYKYTNYDFDVWDNEELGPVCYWMPLPRTTKGRSVQ